ncbi:hypothetical protein AX15_000857 [Amanita polypyramis BW_CC]|nr:hypothetical protein AX15_000857 [Amanita polypyramis BW_CC]
MWLLLLLLLLPLAAAQANGTTASSTITTPPVLSMTTGSITLTLVTRSGNHTTQIVTVLPAIHNVSITSSTPPAPTSSAAVSPSSTRTPIVLATKIDPAFAVLGVLLILTGLPSAFWGHKNRWTSFFLTGFYTFALCCAVLIIRFGVIPAINPPSKTLRGMFVLASAIAGIAGGAIAIFFWKTARYGIGAWGGFTLALWVQCFHDGGVIQPIGFRWILYIGCAVVGFALCTIPKIHYHVLLLSTAFMGSTAFMLGIDCFTTAGLKEFYMWNLGFRSLFPKFTHGIEFPVSQAMEIELGLIAAMALMGIALQFRILTVLQKKLLEIAQERKFLGADADEEAAASERLSRLERERDEWEKEHPTLTKFSRQDSTSTSTPLLKERVITSSPAPGERRSSTYTLVDGRPRYHSGVSDLKINPLAEDVPGKSTSRQSPGVLPTLDLGLGIEENVPGNFIAKNSQEERIRRVATLAELDELRRKEDIMAEIQTLRRSIDALKSETPAPSSSSESRRPSLTSRRTLSIDATTVLQSVPTHLRPPRAVDPRSRVYSMELSSFGRSRSFSNAVTRPTSVPQDEEWEAYIQERKLLQPPAGITPPIATTPIKPAPRISIPSAVQDALTERKRRESALGIIERRPSSSDDTPLSGITQHKKSNSGSNVPVTILPPQKPPVSALGPQRPVATRTLTFEELNERHREKMRDLQGPLTRAEKEHAAVEAAKQRWERAKTVEKQAVARRQAEKAAQLEKKKRAESEADKKRNSLPPHDQRRRHSRSLSADKLGGSHSRRLSVMKVEGWRRYQEETEMGTGASPSGSTGERRGTRTATVDSIPFPNGRREPQG